VHAQAHGRGNDGAHPAATVPGAALLGWNYLTGTWTQLSSNAAGDEPAPLHYTASRTEELQGLLPGSAQTTLAVAPSAFAEKGAERPSVSLDYLELVVTYRRDP
jgi:hypothetical protein